MLETDYLVIGSGAAAFAFVDTLLTELPEAKIIIVDKHNAPGGHWNDAYGHVHLHQPSLLYGVASKQLEGDWNTLLWRKGMLPWKHRASKTEILAYYQDLMDEWVAQGSVQYFPCCLYDFSKQPNANDTSKRHHFYSCNVDNDGSSKAYTVRVNAKLVNATCGENKVPSQCAPEFPIDQDFVKLVTPNDLYNVARMTTNGRNGNYRPLIDKETFVVMGAGKTAMDTVVFLQREMKVHPDQICWIRPNDVWMLRREGTGSPSSWPEALLKTDLDVEKAALLLEERGVFARVDKTVMPTKFRFPVVGQDELDLLRKVKNVIRQGRVQELARDGDNQDTVRIQMAKGEALYMSRMNTTFVHCTSPGPFNGFNETQLFPSEKEIKLWLLFAPPVPISMSCIAVMEGRRSKGLLDIELGRALVKARHSNPSMEVSETDVLNELIHGYGVSANKAAAANDATSTPSAQLSVFNVLLAFFALFDKENPSKALEWMQGNRLSMLSIPAMKAKVYEYSQKMIDKRDLLQLKDGEVEMLKMMADKLRPLEGM